MRTEETKSEARKRMKPTNLLVGPLLTDFYQLTMAYGYWKSERHNDPAVFDLFFRQCPFGGEFVVFAGLEEALRYLSSYSFSDAQIEYLRSLMPHCEPEFFAWLRTVDCSQIKVHAMQEGSVVFPRIPLLRVEGPLAVAQLLETTLLNLVNYPSLVATNAARFRLAAGPEKVLLEFGVRRAQGPDGGLSASRYSSIGGFNATSNVLAGQLFGIAVRGTHAHAFVSSFSGLEELKERTILDPEGQRHDLVAAALAYRKDLNFTKTNEGELAAFLAYAQAFPRNFLALVDTYDTPKSGVPNFLCVALALDRIGYKPVGVRLDSGDLSYLSKQTREMFRQVGERYSVDFSRLTITASNEINEQTLLSLNQQGHEIDVFGIGTHLVTCEAQPSLGCVYKLVEVNRKPRIKLSEDISKMTIPGSKDAYRLVGANGQPMLDLLIRAGEEAPAPGKRLLCRHPFDETKQAYVTPDRVIPLHQCVWDGRLLAPFPAPEQVRAHCLEQLASLRQDHVRPLNPTPYKVSVSGSLYDFIRTLWRQEAPVGEIR